VKPKGKKKLGILETDEEFRLRISLNVIGRLATIAKDSTSPLFTNAIFIEIIKLT